MLAGYRDGKSTEEVFEEAMSLALDDFDERFFGHLRARFGAAVASLGEAPPEPDERSGKPARADRPARRRATRSRPADRISKPLRARAKESPDDFRIQMTYGAALFREERFEEAEGSRCCAAATSSRTTWVPGTPTLCWPKIYRRQEREDEAIEALNTLVASNEMAWDEHLALAELLESAGRTEHEAEILERSLYISPYDLGVHSRLADLALGRGPLRTCRAGTRRPGRSRSAGPRRRALRAGGGPASCRSAGAGAPVGAASPRRWRPATTRRRNSCSTSWGRAREPRPESETGRRRLRAWRSHAWPAISAPSADAARRVVLAGVVVLAALAGALFARDGLLAGPGGGDAVVSLFGRLHLRPDQVRADALGRRPVHVGPGSQMEPRLSGRGAELHPGSSTR